jgi:large subunit ribosomal protein L4
MMKLDILSLAGKKSGSIDLDDGIYGLEPRADLLQRMVRYQLAKRQAGTHKVKSRSEIARTGKKFGRQKGGGGARHGSRRAGIFIGGGPAFGPKPRSHGHELPKKVRVLALKHALSAKAQGRKLVVLDSVEMKEPKTKALSAGSFGQARTFQKRFGDRWCAG